MLPRPSRCIEGAKKKGARIHACGRTRADQSVRKGKTEEALRQQRSRTDAMHGDERARGNGVATPHAAAGEDGQNRMEAAIGKLAAAIGAGAAAPTCQRALDSHDKTRLASGLAERLRIPTIALQ
ncbi:protein of unknown function (plasmid) [Caballeronia sp. S22]